MTTHTNIINFETDRSFIEKFTKATNGILRLFEDPSIKVKLRHRLCIIIARGWGIAGSDILTTKAFTLMIDAVADVRQRYARKYKSYSYLSYSPSWVTDAQLLQTFKEEGELIESKIIASDHSFERDKFLSYPSWDCRFALLCEFSVKKSLNDYEEYNRLEIHQKKQLHHLMRLFVRVADNIALKIESFHRLRALRYSHEGKQYSQESGQHLNKSNMYFVSRDQLCRDLVIRELVDEANPLVIGYVAYDRDLSASKCWNIGGSIIREHIASDATIKHEIELQRNNKNVSGRSVLGEFDTGLSLAFHTVRGVSLVVFHAPPDSKSQEQVCIRMKQFIEDSELYIDVRADLFRHLGEESFGDLTQELGDLIKPKTTTPNSPPEDIAEKFKACLEQPKEPLKRDATPQHRERF